MEATSSNPVTVPNLYKIQYLYENNLLDVFVLTKPATFFSLNTARRWLQHNIPNAKIVSVNIVVAFSEN